MIKINRIGDRIQITTCYDHINIELSCTGSEATKLANDILKELSVTKHKFSVVVRFYCGDPVRHEVSAHDATEAREIVYLSLSATEKEKVAAIHVLPAVDFLKKYVVDIEYYGFHTERYVFAIDEKTARKMVWDELSDAQRNAVSSIDINLAE